MTNPIAFNPDTMTVSQLKEAAETLRTLFHSIERDNPADDIKNYVAQARTYMLKKWHNIDEAALPKGEYFDSKVEAEAHHADLVRAGTSIVTTERHGDGWVVRVGE